MQENERIVSICPTSHGFGFAVFESDSTLVDWGHSHIRPATHSKCIERIVELLSWYSPDSVVIEDTTEGSSRRGVRVVKLLNDLHRFVARTNTNVARISHRMVQESFLPSRSVSKHDIARIIAAHFPELQFQVPPPRKIWMSEDERLSIFNAVALALTYSHGPVFHDDIE